MTKLQEAINAVQKAAVALDLVHNEYERFAEFDHPIDQIAWAVHHKPALMAAEKRLLDSCERLKACGWVKPRGLLPKPSKDLAHDPAAKRPAHAHEQAPQNPD